MAKMFYTLEEAAQQLGVAPDQVKAMAGSGKLQQFRDRDKLMFKRDQVDSMAAKGGSAGGSGGALPLASDETDHVSLAEPRKPGAGRKEDPRQATGVSVFDAGEIEPADPSAQTQITSHPVGDEEELALESVGSGSGLLDLTRESDDTSLGVELDEIYPSGEASDAKLDTGVSGTGVASGSALESALAAEASGASGLENLQAGQGASPGMVPVNYITEEAYDGAGSGMTVGLLFGALVALVVLMFIAFGLMAGGSPALVPAIADSTQTVMMYAGGLLVLSIILGAIGFFVGRSKA
ncbi:MAG: hypothetical protein WD042_11100 [Phycisphaeraceae bacterium]